MQQHDGGWTVRTAQRMYAVPASYGSSGDPVRAPLFAPYGCPSHRTEVFLRPIKDPVVLFFCSSYIFSSSPGYPIISAPVPNFFFLLSYKNRSLISCPAVCHTRQDITGNGFFSEKFPKIFLNHPMLSQTGTQRFDTMIHDNRMHALRAFYCFSIGFL